MSDRPAWVEVVSKSATFILKREFTRREDSLMTTCFDDLRESNEFLNLLLNNISSAVLIADENLQIHQFNDFFVKLFDSSLDTFVEKSFGQVTGCINAVLENKPCGETSQCKQCILRRSLLHTILEKVPTDRMSLERIFYINGEAKQKYLEFSTRPIIYRGQKLILVIIYDVTDIEQKKIELETKQLQLDLDLEAAAGIQQTLLPAASFNTPKIKTAWRFEPCGQIGGDIFNIRHLDKNHVGLYVLDVCGHGVSAALIAVSVSQFLQSTRGHLLDAPRIETPKAVLEGLNHAFPFERFDSYFSIAYATIDHGRGILQYSCAGHPPPVLLQKGRPHELLHCSGPVIGVKDSHSYRQSERKLHRGDRIVFYTDGILESRNRQSEFFGKRRFYGALEANRDRPVQEMVDSVYDAIKTYSRGTRPDDDISLMVVEYKG